MTTQVELTAFSPAKINLYLRILGKRADGYHDLETIMLPLDFGDEIVCQLRSERNFTLECDHPALPTDDNNLALRAAKRLAERCQVAQGAHMILRKRTPLAAGLGGGSSNAAIVLTTLNKLWNLNAAPTLIDELAAGLGSDINFFLSGGAALCHSRGEQVEPIPCRLAAAILLINPGFGISTKWAFESWAKTTSAVQRFEQPVVERASRPFIGEDANGRDARSTTGNSVESQFAQNFELHSKAAAELTPAPPKVSVLASALAGNDLTGVSAALFNSLEAPSVGKFPVLRLLKDAMRAHGAAGALMSGSGATVFGLFADPHQAESCGSAIRREFGPSMWTKVARFAGPQI